MMLCIVVLAVLLGAVAVRGREEPPLATPLPDGLIVREGENIVVREGEWTVLVVLQGRGTVYLQQLQDVLSRATLSFHNHIRERKGKLRPYFLRRLAMLVEMAAEAVGQTDLQTVTWNRKRRGLFNFGGTILNKLFGTVTEEEADEIRSVLSATVASQSDVVQIVNKMATVINKTRHEAMENRDKVNQLINYVDVIANRTNNMWNHMMDIDHNLELTAACDAIQALSLHIYQTERSIADMVQALEYGRLTEGILPPAALSTILAQAREEGFQRLPSVWYYENVKIELVMITDEQSVYRFVLPLAGSVPYLQYVLHSYPVPYNGTVVLQTIKVNEQVALNTRDATMFVPKQCVGRAPVLCRTGPLFTNVLRCERGLVTNHVPDRAACEVISNELQGDLVYEISPSNYVLVTAGVDWGLTCEGRPQRQGTLPTGTYELNINPSCILQGPGWILKGPARRGLTVSIGNPKLSIDPFLFNVVNVSNNNLYVGGQGGVPTLPPMVPMEVPTMTIARNDAFKPGMYHFTAHHFSYVGLGIGLLVVIILAILCKLAWKKRALLTYYFGKPRKSVVKEQPVVGDPPTVVSDQHAGAEAESVL